MAARVFPLERVERERSMLMNTAQVLVKCLESEGVKYIFGIPGEENLEIIEALRDSPIQFITVRHEQGAAFMADMYGRLTGRAGVCLGTLGPGATNLITGVADANMDGAPLVCITGQVGTERMHITSHQYLDLVTLFEPVTKRSRQIVRADTVNEIIRNAFKHAQAEKPGASHVDLPCNIARMEVEEGPSSHPIHPYEPNAELADVTSIRAAADLIAGAERAVVLAGHGAVRGHASEALTHFADTLHIPVINTMMAKGIIPCDDDYECGTIGIPQKDYPDALIEHADLVIAVGYDLVEYAPTKWNPKADHKILHIDAHTAQVNKLYQPNASVVGDIPHSFEKLITFCQPKTVADDMFALRDEMRHEREMYADDAGCPIRPQKVLCDIRKVLGKSDILISDVGAHKMWIARQYPCYRPNTCIISNGFATMGLSVPGAIAAKLVYPDKKVIAVTGDGGFLMNCQELETAVRLKTPFVTLIFHDGSYGLIKWKQMERYHHATSVDFTNPDFVQLAESFHCIGYRIEKAEELLPTLEKAFAQDVPVIIDCPVDYGENMKLTAHLFKRFQ